MYFNCIFILFPSKKNSILFEISLFEVYLAELEKRRLRMYLVNSLREKIAKSFKILVFGALGMIFMGFLTPASLAQSVNSQLEYRLYLRPKPGVPNPMFSH